MSLMDFFNAWGERNTPKRSTAVSAPLQDRTLVYEGNDGYTWSRLGSTTPTESSHMLNLQMKCYLRDNPRWVRVRVVGNETGRLYDLLAR